MTNLAILRAHLFASVALKANDHKGKPNLLVSYFPTHWASVVGSIVVKPPNFFILFSTASTVDYGECPVIAPVSPNAKSIYYWPSISVILFPLALWRYGGKLPAHLFIHVIGTFPNKLFAEL